jgi:hypothetical protein
VHRELRACGFDVAPIRNDKLERPEAIRGTRARSIVRAVHRLHAEAPVRLLLRANDRSPIRGSIRLVATRPASPA